MRLFSLPLLAAALAAMSAVASAEDPPPQPAAYTTTIQVSVNGEFHSEHYLQRGEADGAVAAAGVSGDVTWLQHCGLSLSMAYLSDGVEGPYDSNVQWADETSCQQHKWDSLWTVSEDAVWVGERECPTGEEGRCLLFVEWADEWEEEVTELWVISESGRPTYHMVWENGDAVEHVTQMWTLGSMFVQDSLWSVPSIVATPCPVMADEDPTAEYGAWEVVLGPDSDEPLVGQYKTDYQHGWSVSQLPEMYYWSLQTPEWMYLVSPFVPEGCIKDEPMGSCTPIMFVESGTVEFVGMEPCPEQEARMCSAWSSEDSEGGPVYWQFADRFSPQQQHVAYNVDKSLGDAIVVRPVSAEDVKPEDFTAPDPCGLDVDVDAEQEKETPQVPRSPDVFSFKLESRTNGELESSWWVQYDALAHTGPRAAYSDLDNEKHVLNSCHRHALASWSGADSGSCAVWHQDEEACGNNEWAWMWAVAENSYYVGKHECLNGEEVCHKWRLVDADLVKEWSFVLDGRPTKQSVWAIVDGVTTHTETLVLDWSTERQAQDEELWTGPAACDLPLCPQFGDSGSTMSEWEWDVAVAGDSVLHGVYKADGRQELYVIDAQEPSRFWLRYDKPASSVKSLAEDQECREEFMDTMCPHLFSTGRVGLGKVKECPNMAWRQCAFWTDAQTDRVIWTLADLTDPRMLVPVYQTATSEGSQVVTSLIPLSSEPAAEDFDVIEECL